MQAENLLSQCSHMTGYCFNLSSLRISFAPAVNDLYMSKPSHNLGKFTQSSIRPNNSTYHEKNCLKQRVWHHKYHERHIQFVLVL